MIDRERIVFAVLLALFIYPGDNLGRAFQPEFTKPLENMTIPLGRDVVFTCHVEHLGGYKIGWVKADTKAIQAIHDHVITHNPRVSVFHGDHSTWSLRIKGAQKEDEGLYMCQINTDPMKSQTGMLSIVVPPDFITEETSGDVTVSEGWHVKLKCQASGIPSPRVSWRREDQKEIIIREPLHEKSTTGTNEKFKVHKVLEWIGEELYLPKIKRDQMGVYHCIASNGVPPTISKRIIVDVHFPPVIHVPNQLVGAPLGTDVMLECFVEASPQSINYWFNNNGVMIISSRQHDVQVVTKAPTKGYHTAHPNFNFKVKMLLTIRNFTKQDVGTYRCAASNSNGNYESSIRLYDITSAVKQKAQHGESMASELEEETRRQQQQQQQPEDSESGLQKTGYGDSSTEYEQRQPGSIDNTLQGLIGSTRQTTPSSGLKPRGRRPTSGSWSAAPPALTGLLSLLIYCR